MANRPVRFDFQTDLEGTLKYVHDIPRSFVTPNAQVMQHDPKYIKNFVAAMQPIMLEHEAACRAASNPKCQNCGSPTAKVLQTPMSWLHLVDEPFINVLVNPVCDKSDCEMRTRQQIQDMMAEVTAEVQEAEEYAGKLRDTVEVLPLCAVQGRGILWKGAPEGGLEGA
ncbi:hypothetical protein DM02DRAFT_734224 [Periconia macrospinosa]|uniref:Uncharacterized protein n=1 Tax=Periconia macrospinosa TaxID=97972 RepID=A0A2V1CZY7_9PLEO|nr:hypothetical protein DM02DRAFT_734224 [Periconia macrospinosa]